MTKEYLKKATHLKREIKKMKASIEQLPKEKERYTKLEYKVRESFYAITYLDWKQTYAEFKEKLTLIEKIKLVMYK